MRWGSYLQTADTKDTDTVCNTHSHVHHKSKNQPAHQNSWPVKQPLSKLTKCQTFRVISSQQLHPYANHFLWWSWGQWGKESGMLTWTIGNQTNPTLLCWLMSLKGSQLDASRLLPASKPYISLISYTEVWLTFTRPLTIWIQAGGQMSVYKGGIQANHTSKYSENHFPGLNLESKWDKRKSHSFNTLQQIIINSGWLQWHGPIIYLYKHYKHLKCFHSAATRDSEVRSSHSHTSQL